MWLSTQHMILGLPCPYYGMWSVWGLLQLTLMIDLMILRHSRYIYHMRSYTRGGPTPHRVLSSRASFMTSLGCPSQSLAHCRLWQVLVGHIDDPWCGPWTLRSRLHASLGLVLLWRWWDLSMRHSSILTWRGTKHLGGRHGSICRSYVRRPVIILGKIHVKWLR